MVLKNCRVLLKAGFLSVIAMMGFHGADDAHASGKGGGSGPSLSGSSGSSSGGLGTGPESAGSGPGTSFSAGTGFSGGFTTPPSFSSGGTLQDIYGMTGGISTINNLSKADEENNEEDVIVKKPLVAGGVVSVGVKKADRSAADDVDTLVNVGNEVSAGWRMVPGGFEIYKIETN